MMAFRLELTGKFKNKIYLLLFIIILIVNGYELYVMSKTVSDSSIPKLSVIVEEYKNSLSGPITQELLDSVSEPHSRLGALIADGTYSTQYNPDLMCGYEHGEYYIYDEVYNELTYMTGYRQLCNDIVSEARENIVYYTSQSDNRSAAYNKSLLSIFDGRKITFYNRFDGWNQLFSYGFSSLLLLIFIVITAVNTYSDERDSNMNTLLILNSHSAGVRFRSKLFSGLVFTSAAAIILSVEDFLIINMNQHLGGADNYLYAIEKYRYTAFGGSITKFVLCILAARLIGALSFYIIIQLISALSRSNIVSCVLSGAVMIILILSCNYIPVLNLFDAFTFGTDMCSYTPFYIGTLVIDRSILNVVSIMIFDVVLLILSYIIVKREKYIFVRV